MAIVLRLESPSPGLSLYLPTGFLSHLASSRLSCLLQRGLSEIQCDLSQDSPLPSGQHMMQPSRLILLCPSFHGPPHSPGSLCSSQVEKSCKMPAPLICPQPCAGCFLCFSGFGVDSNHLGPFKNTDSDSTEQRCGQRLLVLKVPGWHPMLLVCDHTFFSQSLQQWFSNLSEHQNDLELWKHKFPGLCQAFWVSRLWWSPRITFVAKSANCLWVEKRGASVSSFLACLLLQFLESHINAWTTAALTEHAKSWDYPPLCSTRQ